MSKKNRLIVGAAAVLVVASLAMVKAGGILFPDWSKPTKGTYDAPAAEIGKKPAEGQALEHHDRRLVDHGQADQGHAHDGRRRDHRPLVLPPGRQARRQAQGLRPEVRQERPAGRPARRRTARSTC